MYPSGRESAPPSGNAAPNLATPFNRNTVLSFLELGERGRGGGLFATSSRDKRAPRVYSDTSPPPSSSAGRRTGRESGWGGCEVTRGRGREVHYGSKVKAMGVFFCRGWESWIRFRNESLRLMLITMWNKVIN